MKQPPALIQLIAELKEAITETSVVTDESSGVHIYLAEADEPIRLNKTEAELILHSTKTVEQLFQALDEPEDACVELHNVTLEEQVQDALERLFAAVDDY